MHDRSRKESSWGKETCMWAEIQVRIMGQAGVMSKVQSYRNTKWHSLKPILQYANQKLNEGKKQDSFPIFLAINRDSATVNVSRCVSSTSRFRELCRVAQERMICFQALRSLYIGSPLTIPADISTTVCKSSPSLIFTSFWWIAIAINAHQWMNR